MDLLASVCFLYFWIEQGFSLIYLTVFYVFLAVRDSDQHVSHAPWKHLNVSILYRLIALFFGVKFDILDIVVLMLNDTFFRQIHAIFCVFFTP